MVGSGAIQYVSISVPKSKIQSLFSAVYVSKGCQFCILIINKNKTSYFLEKFTQEAENLCRKHVGCNIYVFGKLGLRVCNKIEKYMNCFLRKKKITQPGFFWGSGRPNGPDKLHILHVHFECASNKIHISSRILCCRW